MHIFLIFCVSKWEVQIKYFCCIVVISMEVTSEMDLWDEPVTLKKMKYHLIRMKNKLFLLGVEYLADISSKMN